MTKIEKRRRFASLRLDPKSLAQISTPFVILFIGSVAIVYVIHWKVMRAIEVTELHGPENIPAMNALYDAQNSVTFIGVFGLALLGIACLLTWIVYSHKIYGPIIPIRRHIQRLAAGDYSSRIASRAGDQLREVVEDLNSLAEVLADKDRQKNG